MRPLRDDDELKSMQSHLAVRGLPAVEALAHVEQAIALRLGPLRVGVEPLLEEARQQFTVLEPKPGGLRPPPQEQQERQVKLMSVLDQMEDVLEALHLAARGDSIPK